MIASISETCKLDGIDWQAYLTNGITRIIQVHLNHDIDDLIPRRFKTAEAVHAGVDRKRHLQTLGGVTPYESMAEIRTSEPDWFNAHPIPQLPEWSTQYFAGSSHLAQTCKECH